MKHIFIAFVIILFSTAACIEKPNKQSMEVTATAYTSHYRQTLGNPSITGWGDTLKPDMKAIAVSRDLIDSGLTYGEKVRIDDLPDDYIVRDKMNRRWTKRIDIYMGKDVDSAINWGIREVTIQWKTKD